MSEGPRRKTRIIGLGTDVQRADAENSRTVALPVPAAEAAPSFRDAFRIAFPTLRSAPAAGLEQPGIAAVAVHDGRRAGYLCLAAAQQRAASAIVGRHGSTDLYLPADRAMALRHLAVLVEPLDPAEPRSVRFRVLDLRTGTGFFDESGRQLRAVAADGPMFVRAGATVILFVPTPMAEGWQDLGEEEDAAAWDSLPPRSFLEEPPGAVAERRPPTLPSVEGRRPLGTPATGGRAWAFARGTSVVSITGPGEVARRSLLADGEAPIGKLALRDGVHAQVMLVGARAAREGVLLGRYDRCDTGDLPVFQHDTLSRVHALVIEVGGRLHLIDTGSSNGTYVGSSQELARLVVLAPGTEVRLADVVGVVWTDAR